MRRPPTDAERPVHEIVHESSSFWRESLAEEALDNSLANQGSGWCVVPAGQIGGELPVEKFLLPTAPAIPQLQLRESGADGFGVELEARWAAADVGIRAKGFSVWRLASKTLRPGNLIPPGR